MNYIRVQVNKSTGFSYGFPYSQRPFTNRHRWRSPDGHDPGGRWPSASLQWRRRLQPHPRPRPPGCGHALPQPPVRGPFWARHGRCDPRGGRDPGPRRSRARTHVARGGWPRRRRQGQLQLLPGRRGRPAGDGRSNERPMRHTARLEGHRHRLSGLGGRRCRQIPALAHRTAGGRQAGGGRRQPATSHRAGHGRLPGQRDGRARASPYRQGQRRRSGHAGLRRQATPSQPPGRCWRRHPPSGWH